MPRSTSRALIYLCTMISGCVALVFQVVWQKYLSFLVGSEARSISLVVAIFLLGLAVGYRYWGNLTARDYSRQTVLKIVGYIELAIAAYGVLFPYIFSLVRSVSYASPDWLVMDFVIAALLLLLPTFLMGASIPMLTAAVPETAAEVNFCHSRIYGLNTLGAFFGAFLGGFFLVPVFGLPLALILAAFVNIAVAVVFIFNRLPGAAHKSEDVPVIPNRFGTLGVYLFVFVTGAVTIGYEILFMRILGLSAGSGHYIFPIVVGVVILGLAIGSLSIRRSGLSERRVFVELLIIAGLLCVIYFTVPYWGYWISNIRVSLTTIESNHAVFMVMITLFVAVVLLPVAIPMGRLLPVGYALINKSRDDYGKVCGRLYFVNTLGTVVGAVGIGYSLFLFLDLEYIFKINISLLLLLVAGLFYQSRRHRKSALALVSAGAVMLLPSWDRELHYLGLFRITASADFHFQGLFEMPRTRPAGRRMFLADDPNTTVGVFEAPVRLPGHGELVARTLTVNGKVDGNTIVDYSNMTLSGVLPYLFAESAGELEAAVVGLGTGITSGVLASAADVKEVVTLEISAGVIEALRFFEEESFGLPGNPKSTIVQVDAFRYFARTDRRFDVIASEPSNPWVVGVENLFTPEYYRLAGSRLREGGIFFQWLQVYETSGEIVAAIVENILDEFPHVSMYAIGRGDVGLVASYRALDAPHLERRFAEPAVRQALAPIELDDYRMLAGIEVFQLEQLKSVALLSLRRQHSLDHPWLGYEAGRARFLAQAVNMRGLISPWVARHHVVTGEKRARFRSWSASTTAEEVTSRCSSRRVGHSARFVCNLLTRLERHHSMLQKELSAEAIVDQLASYQVLRNEGFLAQDLGFLERARTVLLASSSDLDSGARTQAVFLLLTEYAAEWEWERASEVAADFRGAGLLSEAQAAHFGRQMGEARQLVAEWVRLRHGRDGSMRAGPG